ncbi:hypothetical protein HY991_04990, partial [Candidatus Micrarchaeota archaeon]|nr:hypothetical protein [Candidatus Micrarchaeota archaeon]
MQTERSQPKQSRMAAYVLIFLVMVSIVALISLDKSIVALIGLYQPTKIQSQKSVAIVKSYQEEGSAILVIKNTGQSHLNLSSCKGTNTTLSCGDLVIIRPGGTLADVRIPNVMLKPGETVEIKDYTAPEGVSSYAVGTEEKKTWTTINIEKKPTFTREYRFNAKPAEKSGTYDIIELENTSLFGSAGKPMTPSKTASLLLPAEKNLYKIKVTFRDKVLLGKGFRLMPGQKIVPLIDASLSTGIPTPPTEKNITDNLDFSFPNETSISLPTKPPYIPSMEIDRDSPIELPAESMPTSVLTGKKVEFTEPDPEIYNSLSVYPSEDYSMGSVQNYRGYEIANINIYPMKYIPKTGEVYYYRTAVVEVQYRDTT